MCQGDALHILRGRVIPDILCLLSDMKDFRPFFSVRRYFKVRVSQVIELRLDNVVAQG